MKFDGEWTRVIFVAVIRNKNVNSFYISMKYWLNFSSLKGFVHYMNYISMLEITLGLSFFKNCIFIFLMHLLFHGHTLCIWIKSTLCTELVWCFNPFHSYPYVYGFKKEDLGTNKCLNWNIVAVQKHARTLTDSRSEFMHRARQEVAPSLPVIGQLLQFFFVVWGREML
jgi:hypothetical protein